ncbi:DegT family aminotransferase [Helicobacter cinaedi]|uniref:DegT family aminotransferase n=1 Tax=Helicobacter cinaedi TaxID=213 RepID=A0A377JRN2_9HELI|nr:lipopolysaccharide biosynthesis protein RfbH [Helicobacter cinaedi]STP10537.1 DegT family aminotransferase [Helicobacter cinaedi]
MQDLRQEIFKSIKRYYDEHHNCTTPFKEGESKINYAGRVYDEKEMINLVDTALDFWLTSSKYSLLFEKKLSDFLNIKYTLLVNSGSSANLLAFFALTSPLLKERQIQRGDEVITLAAGFPTTIAPIIQYGAIPVFVDINLHTLNIETKNILQAITSKTRAIFIAHTLGNPFNIASIMEICKKYNLWLIEDNCDALGATFAGNYTGTFGDIGTSSFYPAHHITMGEGGAVYTNNPTLKKILLSMRDWGRDCWCLGGKDNTCRARFSQQFGKLPFGYDHKYVYSHFGFNLKATEMQAAIGVAQLDKLSNFIKTRRENYKFLFEGLKHLDSYFIFSESYAQANPSYFGFCLTLRDNVSFTRDAIVSFLENRNIQTRNLFGGNMLYQPAFMNLQENKDYRISGSLSQTNKIMRDGFWIGVYPGLTQQQLTYIVQSICDFIDLHNKK